MLLGAYVSGQAGVLDATFDGDGIAFDTIGDGDDHSYALTLQPDGKIVVAGAAFNGVDQDLAVMRLQPDGSLDPGFSGDGKVTTDIGTEDYGLSVGVQPDGKVVVAGYTMSGAAIVIIRYQMDGELDTTFGSAGIVISDPGPGVDIGSAVALQPDGRIVVAGRTFNGVDSDIALLRFDNDGSPDSTFGANGIAITAPGIGDDRANALAILPDGRVVVAGSSYIGADLDVAMVRYLSDGTPDSSFAGDGVATYPDPYEEQALALIVQPDGKCVLAGYDVSGTFGDADILLSRVDTTGMLDGTFGTGGLAVHSLGPGDDVAHSVTLQPDGKILVGGNVGWGTLEVLRLLPNGSMDNTFDADGEVSLFMGGGAFPPGTSITLQPDGKILTCGAWHNGFDKDFAVVRYLNDLYVGMQQITPRVNVRVHPNPSPDGCVVEYGSTTSGALTCELFDDQGRSVRTLFSNAFRAAGSHREMLDLSDFASGSYTIVLSNGQGRVSVQVVKQ